MQSLDLIKTRLSLILLMATADTGGEARAGETAPINPGLPAPAAVCSILSDSSVTMSWARTPGASGYHQVWEWLLGGDEMGSAWEARERRDAGHGRQNISCVGKALPRRAVSSLFVRADGVVSSQPTPAVFSATPRFDGERKMHTPLPPWALPLPDREEVEFGLYGKRREDALIDFILQHAFRFPRWLFRQVNQR